MKRRNFIKGMAAVAVAPKVLAEEDRGYLVYEGVSFREIGDEEYEVDLEVEMGEVGFGFAPLKQEGVPCNYDPLFKEVK